MPCAKKSANAVRKKGRECLAQEEGAQTPSCAKKGANAVRKTKERKHRHVRKKKAI